MDVTGAAENLRTENNLTDVYGAIGPLFPILYSSPVLGIAVIDARMRFQAVNEALAAMNGLPAPSHIGKPLRYALGDAAPVIEKVVAKVIQTGEPVANLEITAKLPERDEMGHWVKSFFPIRGANNRVTKVAAVVAEVTQQRRMEEALRQLTSNLLRVGAAVQAELELRKVNGLISDEAAGLLPRTMELIDYCLDYARIASVFDGGVLPVAPVLLTPRLASMPFADASGRRKPNKPRSVERMLSRLSKREGQVLKLLANGSSNKDVAAEMGITVRTAETYRARLMMKLELHSVGQLVRFAVRNRLIEA